jgi:hypothetical protein
MIEKLTVSQIQNVVPTLHGTRWLVTVFAIGLYREAVDQAGTFATSDF